MQTTLLYFALRYILISSYPYAHPLSLSLSLSHSYSHSHLSSLYMSEEIMTQSLVFARSLYQSGYVGYRHLLEI